MWVPSELSVAGEAGSHCRTQVASLGTRKGVVHNVAAAAFASRASGEGNLQPTQYSVRSSV